MADNLILVTVKSKTIGSDNIYRDNNIKPSNIVTYSTPQQQAVDILNLATPIRYNPNTGLTYFSVRDNASTQKENRNVGIVYYTCTDSIATLAAGSADLVALTVVKRRLEVIASEIMLFQTSKIIGVIDVDGSNSRFQYLEDGDPNLVMYEVTQTPAQIVSAGISPIFNMNGWEFYVNDLVGNDATAEAGNPLLPWATFDAAMTKATTYGQGTIIVTGDRIGSLANAFSPNINIEIRPAAQLYLTSYTASGSGNQVISGGGFLQINTTMLADSTFNGNITIDVWNIGIGQGNTGDTFINASTNNGVISIECDYLNNVSHHKLYTITGTTNEGKLIVKSKYTDSVGGGSGPYISAFYINPSALIVGDKYFNFYIASGKSLASNEGVLTLSAIDSTYNINAELNLDYDGSQGSPGLNAILSCYNCTGGKIILKGTQNIITQGRNAIILNSAVTIYDYSNAYQINNINNFIILAGGTSYYTLYGKKLVGTHASAINVGLTFTSTNATVDFGTPTATAGTDTLHFKGGLKCTYTNTSAIGVLVGGGNPNLVIDGGTIEMVNSNTLNYAISAATAQNIKVLGTGFVRGAVNSNITNTITGTNIIQDAGVTANI